MLVFDNNLFVDMICDYYNFFYDPDPVAAGCSLNNFRRNDNEKS